MGLHYIIGGVVLFVGGQVFVVTPTRLIVTGIGLILALVGVGKYSAEQVADYLRRRGH